MLRSSILVLLCVSSVLSVAVKKEPTEKEVETEKSKRYAIHPTPCPPEHQHFQPWQPESKIISYVKPQLSGWQQPKWQSQPSGWQQPHSSGWKPDLTGYQQPKLSYQKQPNVQVHSSGWQQPKWQPQSSGWQQPKWQPQSYGWPQPKLQLQSYGWPQPQKWQPQSSGWQQPKWQPQPSGWQQPHSSGWKPDLTGYQQPKLSYQKPILAYASQYKHHMVEQPWAPISKPCPLPCKPSHSSIQYAPSPQIKIPLIKYIKPQVHQPVYLPPPSQNKLWEAPCD